MIKYFNLKDLSFLMEKAPVTYFGCPFHLNVDDYIINYIADQLIWNAPYRAIVFTNSHLFTISLFDKLTSVYKNYSYEYEYKINEYCFYDKSDDGAKKSEIQIFNFQSKKELAKKVKRGFYDRGIFHFVDNDISTYLEQMIAAVKTMSFFTLDDKDSLFYKLGEEELKNFYRLYDNKSNNKIEELEKEGIIDNEKERLFKGLFIK